MSNIPDIIGLIENRNELLKYLIDKHTTTKALDVDIPKQVLPFQGKIDHIVPHKTIVSEL